MRRVHQTGSELGSNIDFSLCPVIQWQENRRTQTKVYATNPHRTQTKVYATPRLPAEILKLTLEMSLPTVGQSIDR